MARALIALALLALLTSGCVSGADSKDSELTTTSSPSRYAADPDKPKRVCESTMIGNEPKNVCY